jgi:DNA polymerase III delta subunit
MSNLSQTVQKWADEFQKVIDQDPMEMLTKQEEDTTEFIDNNIEKLQDIHADGYMGTDDNMPDAFNSWVTNFSLQELQEMCNQ